MWLSLSHPPPYFPAKTPNPNSNSSKPLILRCAATSKAETASRSAIQRISDKLRSLGYLENPNPNSSPNSQTLASAGEIFIPTPQEIPNRRVGHTIDVSWSTPETPVPVPGTGLTRFRELWRKEKEEERGAKEEEGRVPMVAELTIAREELKRLRRVGIRIEKRLKVGKAGITEGIVNGIHERWQNSELVKIKCEDLCRMNMKRTHEILERKTGGLVVWRSGSIIILYRGANYKYPYFSNQSQINSNLDGTSEDPSTVNVASTEQDENALSTSAVTPSAKSPNNLSRSSLVFGVGSPDKVRLQLPGEVQLEEEADKLLDGLGPRFTDWWGYEPLPVDADLLPAIVPGFRKPFRLLPFGVKPKLTDREMTILRRLSHPLPCHFALGRNKKLQGLAASMIKLWEKCEVAKIAIKRGVQNTNSEMMAEEVKQLTGGVLLSRDKEFIVFYRGKDFLPSAISTAIEERRNYEVGRQKHSSPDSSMDTTTASASRFARPDSIDEPPEASRQTINRLKPASLAIKSVETKLSQALEKKEKAEKLLATLEKSVEPPAIESDREAITEEERYMLRKIGLRMNPFLLLGRRGVFAGTVENMHLHWKYRELVKIISKDRSIKHVEIAARTLESESGGILVAVERVSKGHAIIIYRGKNYRRPAVLKPKTLLNKKEAMKRSLEAQRCASLKLHVLSLSRNIDHLQHQAEEYSVMDTMQSTESNKLDKEDEMNEQSWSIEEESKPAESFFHHGNTEGEEYSVKATMQLTESDKSEIKDEMNEQSWSTEQDKKFTVSSYHQETSEEVNEAATKYLHSNAQSNLPIEDGEAPITSDNVLKSTLCMNLRQKQAQFMVSATSDLSHHSVEEEAELSFMAAQNKPDPYAREDNLKYGSDTENIFRAAPLSNRERLVLRKQALKMKKRPVLAVGRNNIVAGVAKTIKTHFRKHPLAIVNIKGRAEGTSVQEVIFELEQATGAVLVSREPNKVILYRGWGEGEEPGGNPKETKDVKKGSSCVNLEENVSPKLIEAIRMECGLSTSIDE